MRVALCIPSGDRWHAGFALDVAKLVGYTGQMMPDVELVVLNVRGSILPQLRATLANQALDAGADALLWLDADMRFPKDALRRLLAHDAPVVGANYSTRQPPIIPTAQRGTDPVYTAVDSGDDELVDRLGFGCVLVRAEVFRVMDKPWFAFGYARAEDGYVGEDYFFFQKVRAAGFDVLLDHRLSRDVFHLGEIPLSVQHANMIREEEFAGGTR